MSYYLPAKWCEAAQRVGAWLKRHAYWSNGLYSSWVLPLDLAMDGICGSWNSDFGNLSTLIDACT